MTPKDKLLIKKMEGLMRTEATRHLYGYSLNRFLAFAGWTPSQLVAQKPRVVEDRLLDFYQSHRGWQKTRINVMKCAISLFGEANGKEYTFKRLKRALPAGNPRPKDKAPTLEEGREMLKHCDLRGRALLLTAASSGLRRGALQALKLQDITPVPSGTAKVIAYAGEPEEYTTFITPEAWAAVQDYIGDREARGEKVEPASQVFVMSQRRTFGGDAMEVMMRRLMRRCEVKGVKPLHGWRKFAKTQYEKGTKTLVAEWLLGHRTGLQAAYFKPTEDELAAEYLKCVPFLTFSPEYSLKGELIAEKGRNDDLSKTVLRIESELVMIRSWIAQLPPYAVVPPSARQPLEAGRLSDSGATP